MPSMVFKITIIKFHKPESHHRILNQSNNNNNNNNNNNYNNNNIKIQKKKGLRKISKRIYKLTIFQMTILI